MACFDFEDICGHPLGPADYFAVAQAFHTVVITNVPNFSLQVRSWGLLSSGVPFAICLLTVLAFHQQTTKHNPVYGTQGTQ